MPLVNHCGQYTNRLDSKTEIKILLETIQMLKPDLVGFGVMTNYFGRAIRLTAEIKNIYPNIPIVFGGIHATICPKDCLEFADIVCLGEAEETILELCNTSLLPEQLNNIKGIAYKKGNQVICNELRLLEENLDKYPFPDYGIGNDFIILRNRISSLDLQTITQLFPKYLFGMLSYRIMTSRGCPFSCSYCCNYTLKNMWKGKGKYVRTRSVKNVIAEMVSIKNKFPIEAFRIMDDSFLFSSLQWFEDFHNDYKAMLDLPFSCLSHPSNATYPKLKLLGDCGLNHIQLGLQTGSERINFDVYNRKVENRKFLKTVEIIKSLNPVPLVSIDVIFDNPLETKKDKIETIELLKQISVPYYLGCFSLEYFPKTGISDVLKAKGLISDNLRGKKYDSSYLRLKYDYLNGLIILTSIRYISSKVTDFLLKIKPIGYIAGILFVIMYNNILIKLIPFIKSKILRRYKRNSD